MGVVNVLADSVSVPVNVANVPLSGTVTAELFVAVNVTPFILPSIFATSVPVVPENTSEVLVAVVNMTNLS